MYSYLELMLCFCLAVYFWISHDISKWTLCSGVQGKIRKKTFLCSFFSVISPSTSCLARADQLALFKWCSYTPSMETVSAYQTKVIWKNQQFSFCLPPVSTHSKTPFLRRKRKHPLLDHLTCFLIIFSFFAIDSLFTSRKGTEMRGFLWDICFIPMSLRHLSHFSMAEKIQGPALVLSYHSCLPAELADP